MSKPPIPEENTAIVNSGEIGVIPPGTIIGGRFRVDRCLGKGGMGIVYRFKRFFGIAGRDWFIFLFP